MITAERSLSYLSFNISGRARREVLDGRDFLVVPVVSIVPGVLDGSQGALFYAENHVRAAAPRWNGIPITDGHPYRMGRPISASELPDEDRIGFLRNSRFRGRLEHEAWFDVEKTKAKNKRIYNAVLNGEPMEVSTGLYTENRPAPEGSAFKGKAYQFFAENHGPDHLAVLADQLGACSIRDGCGLNVNAKAEQDRDEAGRFSAQEEAVIDEEAHKRGMSSEELKKQIKANAQVRNTWSDAAREAATAARQAKGFAKNDDKVVKGASAKAGKATSAAAVQSETAKDRLGHEAAADSHRKAAREHYSAASTLQAAGNREAATAHMNAHGYHKEAAEAHIQKAQTMNANSKPTLFQRFMSLLLNQSEDIDPDKACQILHDGTAQGHPLTEDQRGMFGAACGRADNARMCWGKPCDENSEPAGTARRDAVKYKIAAADAHDAAVTETKKSGWSMGDVSRHSGNAESRASKGDYEGAAKAHTSAAKAADKYPDGAKEAAAHRKAASAFTQLHSYKEKGFIDNEASTENAGVSKPKHKAKFEDPSEELHEDDAPAELVGEQTTPDGRGKSELEGSLKPMIGGEMDDHQNPKIGPKDPQGVRTKMPPAANFGGGFGAAPSFQPAPPHHDASKEAAGASLASEHDEAFGHAQRAMGFSKKGNSAQAAKSHGRAAEAHEEAATAARKDKDQPTADQHDAAAALHRKAASMHAAFVKNQRSQPMDRKSTLAALTANCACEKSKQIVNSLSDEMLELLAKGKPRKITVNAAGQLAFVLNTQSTSGSGSETVQAGGEEDTYSNEGEGLEDEDEVGDKEVKGKKKTMNELLRHASRDDQEAWAHSQRLLQNHRFSLIRRLVENIGDDKQRKLVANMYNQRFKTTELEQLVRAMPQQVRNAFADLDAGVPVEPQVEPNFLGQGADVMAFNTARVTANVGAVEHAGDWPPQSIAGIGG